LKRRKSSPTRTSKPPKPGRPAQVEDAEEDDATLEDTYHASTHEAPLKHQSDDDEDSSEGEQVLQHETVTGSSKSKTKAKKKKVVRENESKEDRDRRTIFVGNLPIDVMKSKVIFIRSSQRFDLNSA
jgi:nucleolar protein 12